MRPAALGCVLALLIAACAPSGHGLPGAALDDAIASAIGDPSTCVLIADRPTGMILYRYGDEIACTRTFPACDAKDLMNAREALQFAAIPGGRLASCPTNPDGSHSVGWAAGRIQSPTRDLVYSAVMEGERALPGRIMSSRLADAFAVAAL